MSAVHPSAYTFLPQDQISVVDALHTGPPYAREMLCALLATYQGVIACLLSLLKMVHDTSKDALIVSCYAASVRVCPEMRDAGKCWTLCSNLVASLDNTDTKKGAGPCAALHS